MPDRSVHYPPGWGDFVIMIGNVVNDRGIRGALYRATHKSSFQRVLLKVSPPPNAPDKPRLEYEVVSRLGECEHILKVLELTKLNLDPQSTESRDAIVCEDFGESVPVSQLIAVTPTGLSLDMFISISLPILEALCFAHSRDVLHGDVNPACMLYNQSTKTAKLYDFGSAVPVPRSVSAYLQTRPEGTIGFIPPDSWVDTRFDVYSMGVSMYNMLSGKMPVVVPGAEKAPMLHELSLDIPLIVSQMVEKAMATDPNERYQSIYGLMADVRTCAEYIMLSAVPPEIRLATQDFSTTFRCHTSLVGHEKQFNSMRDVFARVASSKKSEVIALEGATGARKSRVFAGLLAEVSARTDRYCCGNFRPSDNMSYPLDVIVQMVRSLFRILLATTKSILLGKWRLRLIRLCGPRLAVLTNVVPEAQSLIGKHNVEFDGVPSLESKNTFYRLFSDLIIAFTEDSLVVLVLENLQWADASALELLSELLENCTTNLLLVCGYTPLSDPDHIVHKFLAGQRGHVCVTQFTLDPLTPTQLNADLCESIRPKNDADTHPFALQLAKLTKGNAFVATQAARTLFENSSLRFDWEKQKWTWSLEEMEKMCSGSLQEFLDKTLSTLPSYAQLVLKVAAHVGFVFSASLLSKLSSILPHQIETSLAICRHSGFIMQRGDVIQKGGEAIYQFATEDVRCAAESRFQGQNLDLQIHLEIGKALLVNVDDVTCDLFSAVRHMNKALPIIYDTENRDRLRRLNLRAAKLGNYGISFEFALDCIRTAMMLQPADAWQSNYEETLDIYNVCVKSEFILGNVDKALQLHEEIKRNCRTTYDKLASLVMLLNLYVGALKYARLVELGRECFALVGYNIPDKLVGQDIKQAKIDIDELLKDRAITDLHNMPPMTDPLSILLLETGWLLTNTFYYDTTFFSYVYLRLTALTIKHGWAPRSGISFTYTATIYNHIFNDPEKSYAFATVAIALSEKYCPNSVQLYTTVTGAYSHACVLGNHHIRESIPPLTEAYNQLLRFGDKTYARVASAYLCGHKIFVGENLFLVLPELVKIYRKLTDYGPLSRLSVIHICAFIEYCRGMMGPLATDADSANISALVEQKEVTAPDFLTIWYFYLRGSFNYLLGNYEEALKLMEEGYTRMRATTSFSLLARYVFFHSMIIGSLYGSASTEKKAEYLTTLNNNQVKQKKYKTISEVNCGHLYTIVEATLSRITEGPTNKTAELYEVAASESNARGFVVEEALANELYGEFLLKNGLKLAGSMLLQNASKKYYAYGAAAKCKQLEERYFADEKKSDESEEEILPSVGPMPKLNVDFAFAKASQLLSQEIDIDKLVEKAMEIIVEHAGADHGVLMIREMNIVTKDVYSQLMVKAIWENRAQPTEGSQESKNVKIYSTMVSMNGTLAPESLVAFVAHSRRLLVINDIPGSDFAYDEYFSKKMPKSVLCLPIQQMGSLKGVLFLESMTSSKIFSAQRLQVIDFLCAQIGISLENALLYSTSMSSEKQYQILADAIPQSIFTANPDGHIYFANKRLAEFLGTEQGPKAPWPDYLHPSHRKEIEKAWAHCIATGKEYDVEYLLRRHDGVFKWVQARGAPVRNHEGNIIKWFGTVTDIDDKKKEAAELAMRAQLEASEKKYRLLAEAIPIMVWSANSEGIADYANQKFVDYMGFNVTKVPFSWGPDSIYFEDWLVIKDKWMRALRDKTSFEAEYRVKRGRDGVYRWHLVRALPMHEQHSSDSVVRWFGTCTDVHSQKMAEIELVLARESAEQTAQNQAAFLANMSHEIRTPLNGILGMIDILIDSALTSEQREYANTIQRSGDSLLNIVNDILDFSKIQAGKMILRESEFHVEDTVADVCELLITLANNKGLALSFLVSADVPPVVIGDSTRLRQILVNLVGNGIKFTSTGEIFVHCKLVDSKTTEPGTANLEFRISDSGVGLTVPQQLCLFKPFFQADTSTTRKVGGTGLGLAICKQLVNLMGGEIQVESEEGVGSCFYFNVKFKVPPSQTTPSPGKNLLLPTQLPKARAIVFYDQPSRKVVLAFHLNGFGIPIVPCDNLAAAKDAVQSNASSCDRLCIIIDVSSKKDALDFINSTIQFKMQPSPLIIVITAQHERVLYENYPDPMQVCCLCKPVTHSKLAASLASIFNSHKTDEKHTKIPVSPKCNPSYPHFGNKMFVSNGSKHSQYNNNNNNQTYQNYQTSSNNDRNILTNGTTTNIEHDYNSPTSDTIPHLALEEPTNIRSTNPRNSRSRSDSTLLVHTLIVDDNEINVKVIVRRMEKVGARVSVATDGLEAVNLYKANPDSYDVILMDLFMPNMDGLQATREIRKWEKERGQKHIPIISLTANVMPDIVRDCLGAGMNDYISKPIDFAKLYASIARLLARPKDSTSKPSSSSPNLDIPPLPPLLQSPSSPPPELVLSPPPSNPPSNPSSKPSRNAEIELDEVPQPKRPRILN